MDDKIYQVIKDALKKCENQLIGRELAARFSSEINEVLRTQADNLGFRGPDELNFDLSACTPDSLAVKPGDRYTAFVAFNATNGIRTDFHRDNCPLELDVNGTKVQYDDSTGNLTMAAVEPVEHIEITFKI